MKYQILLVLLMVGSVKMLSQDKKYVVFSAKASGVGHAFITLGREDPVQMMTVHDGSWGLYPQTSRLGGKSFLIGEVPGKMKDDFLTKRDYNYVLTVSGSEYAEVLEKLNIWRGKNYELLKSDCLSFLIDVANVFKSRIKVPERSGFDNHPAQYLQALIEENQ